LSEESKSEGKERLNKAENRKQKLMVGSRSAGEVLKVKDPFAPESALCPEWSL
jgi:hypothetical protein